VGTTEERETGGSSAAPTEPPRINDRNRWVALYVLCISVLMIVLDVTVVNVALPSIKDDLGFSQSSLAWVVNAYLITFGGLLLLAGRLGDLIGRRTILLYGLAVFVIASVLCGLSQSEGMLIGARLLQGIGGAMTSAVVLGMIVTMFPEPRERPRRSGSTRSSRRPEGRSGCSPAVSSPRRSAGTGSSSSMPRSASSRRSTRIACSRRTRGSASARARTRSGLS
jgi:MFS family permease